MTSHVAVFLAAWAAGFVLAWKVKSIYMVLSAA